MKKILLSILTLHTTLLFAQNDSTGKLSFNGYGEVYYSNDFTQNPYHEKADFTYNHRRNNEINANLLLVQAQYSNQNIRGNVGLMAGNYAHYNLSDEPVWAQFIYQANIGVKLSSRHNIWLDAGILPSHIGFESAIGADCWTLTRSILAENSPYFETGLKLSYASASEKLNLAFLVMNGWQRITMPDYSQRPSFGIQVNYQANEQLVLNYSNFIGSRQPDSVNAWRLFNDFYLQYTGNKFGLIAAFDIGTDKYDGLHYGVWYAPILIAKYSISQKFDVAGRIEYYNDKNQANVVTVTPNGFQISGVSANIDYNVRKNARFRLEGKLYDAKDPLFSDGKSNNFSATASFCLKI